MASCIHWEVIQITPDFKNSRVEIWQKTAKFYKALSFNKKYINKKIEFRGYWANVFIVLNERNNLSTQMSLYNQQVAQEKIKTLCYAQNLINCITHPCELQERIRGCSLCRKVIKQMEPCILKEWKKSQ